MIPLNCVRGKHRLCIGLQRTIAVLRTRGKGRWAEYGDLDRFRCNLKSILCLSVQRHACSRRLSISQALMSTQPYTGDEKLVFAVDCGTTMSETPLV